MNTNSSALRIRNTSFKNMDITRMTTKNKDDVFIYFIGLLYFAVLYIAAFKLYEQGVFTYYNLLFDTDIPSNLKSLAHGTVEGRNTYTHAFLELLAIPVLLVQKVITLLFGWGGDPVKIREYIAIGISPAASALTIVVFYKSIKKLNKSRLEILVLTLVFALMASNITFALVPETYAISSLIITVLFYMYISCSEQSDRFRTYSWLFIAIIISGITITNIVIFALVFFAHTSRQNKNMLLAGAKTVLVSTTALIIVFCIYKLHLLISSAAPADFEGGKSWLSSAIKNNPSEAIANFVNLVTASFNSFFAFDAKVTVIEKCNSVFCEQLTFTRNKSDILFIFLSFFSLFFLILGGMYRLKNTKHFPLALTATFVIGFNFCFHTIFGKEMFLYTQHWVPALMFLLALAMQNLRLALLVLLSIEIIVNIQFLYQILNMWSY